jgi:hypothetical protein
MSFLTTIECEDYARRIGPKKDVLDRRKLGTLKKGLISRIAAVWRTLDWLQQKLSRIWEILNLRCCGHMDWFGVIAPRNTMPRKIGLNTDCGERNSARRAGFSNFRGNCSTLQTEPSWLKDSSEQFTPDRMPSFSRVQPAS